METKPNKLSIKETDAVKLKECCDGCGKPVNHLKSGNITNWLFRGRYCQCQSEATARAAKNKAEADILVSSQRGSARRDGGGARDSILVKEPDHRLVQNSSEGRESHTNGNQGDDDTGSGIAELSRKKIDDTQVKTREILPAALLAARDPRKLIGKIVGNNYQIVDYLGKGQTGHAFKAQREGIDGAFVLKILEPSVSFTKRHVNAFLREAELARELDHHNVIALYEAGTTDDEIPYVVTDYFEGKSLSEILEEEELLDESKAIDLFIQICEGLSHAHSCGLIHRDVKPGNVRVKQEASGNLTVKILDCGVSKVLPNSGRETRYFTEHGIEYGDATYMSPEQCTGSAIDVRSDIYSLGCLMYICLTGKPVFSSEQPSMLMYKHVRTIPRRIEKRFPELKLSRDLENLVMRCLEKDPSNRYQSTADLKDDLEAIKATRPVRRSFKRRLSQRGQVVLPAIPDSIFAPILSFWFGLTSNQRFWMLSGVFLLIGASTFYPLLQADSYQNKLESLITRVDDDLSTTVVSNPPLHEDLARFKEDIVAARYSIGGNPLLYLLPAQRKTVDELAERLQAYEQRMDTQFQVEHDLNEIVDKQGQSIVFSAPSGTSQTDAIKLAVANRADLSGADLRGVDLGGLTFDHVKLTDADLTNTTLRGAHFRDCDMSGANFSLCDLRHAQIANCNLSGANFNEALLERATIYSSFLDNAKFEFADIRELDILGGTCANVLFNGDTMEGFSVSMHPGSLDNWNLSDMIQRDFEDVYEISFAAEMFTAPGGTADQALEVPLLGKSNESVMLKPLKAQEAKDIQAQTSALSNKLLELIREARLIARLQAEPGSTAVETGGASGVTGVHWALRQKEVLIAKQYDALKKSYSKLNELLIRFSETKR